MKEPRDGNGDYGSHRRPYSQSAAALDGKPEAVSLLGLCDWASPQVGSHGGTLVLR